MLHLQAENCLPLESLLNQTENWNWQIASSEASRREIITQHTFKEEKTKKQIEPLEEKVQKGKRPFYCSLIS